MWDSLKLAFRKREDWSIGVDLVLARKMASVLWVMGALLMIALWPLSDPDRALDQTGWAMASAAVFLGVLVAYSIRARPSLWNLGLMLASAYAAVAAISLLQWLAGGVGAPYESLLLIPVLFVSAIYPPRVIAVFFIPIGLSLAAPLVYDDLSGPIAANAIVPFVLWTALSVPVFQLMSKIRAQRLSMMRDEEHAREEARVDELTGIGNRRAFEERLIEEMSRADRGGTPLSMAMGDIEHFKRINDEFGHLEGDRCLRSVAQAMESEFRTADHVFRWGGDEFTLLLPDTGREGVDALIERVQKKVSVACRRPDNEPVWIHFAAAEFRRGMSATELTEAADMALMAERARDERERV